MRISTSFRLAIVPVVVSASVLGFAHSASATAASNTNCKASAGVNSIVYKVNGKAVADLRGKVGQGNAVSIDFKIATGCSNVPVNISAYQAPSPIWDPKVADKQVLVGSAIGNYSADGKVHTLNITAPNCYYQVDFGTGVPMTNITGTYNQSSLGDLISADNGGTKACSTTPTTVAATPTTISMPTTTTTVHQITPTTIKSIDVTIPAVTTTTAKATVAPLSDAATAVPVVNLTPANSQVQNENLVANQTPVLASSQLAHTGSDSATMALYGLLLVIFGSVFVGVATAIKRRRI